VPQRQAGVVLEGFRQSARDALTAAARLAFRHIEFPATAGDVTPENLTPTGRRHLAHFTTGLGLELNALGADLGETRFADSSTAEQCLQRTQRIIELAADLRVPIVTTHLGQVTRETQQQGHLSEAIHALANLADRTGTFIAFETGSAEPDTIAGLLRQVNCESLGVCYDPASLLIDGFNPLDGVQTLADRILIARARDAVAGTGQQPGREVALGHGQIDMQAYLARLEAAGYASAPFIRRTAADDPLQELAEAKQRLETLLR
jgi:sugar phosphate isomerase/epimerase